MAPNLGVQQSVTTQPVPGLPGDFCDGNPRYAYDAGPLGLQAGPQGLTAGLFAWVSQAWLDSDNAPAQANNYGQGVPQGFTHRNQQGLITTYLQTAGMNLPQGFQAVVFSSGGFWCTNAGATQAMYGMKAFANLSNGSVSFAAAGTAPGQSTSTASTIAPATWTAVGGIQGNQMTLSTVSAGTVVAGGAVSGAAAGTQVVGQVSGTPGGAGVYTVTPGEQNVANGANLNGTYGLLTVGGTVTGTYGPGQSLTGGTTAAGTVITQNLTGAGGAGTYAVSPTQTVASAAINANTSIETGWYARSSGMPGEPVKISNLPSNP